MILIVIPDLKKFKFFKCICLFNEFESMTVFHIDKSGVWKKN